MKVYFRCTTFILFLLALLTLAGCGGEPVLSAPSQANSTVAPGQGTDKLLALPTAANPSQPTATATLVIAEYPPTHTPTATPTFAPTRTPEPQTLTTPIAVISTPAPASAGTAGAIEHVVLISIDGLRPDALEQANTPTLDGLRARGAYHPASQAVLPSVTLVNHASMLGGMTPEKHGIDWNEYDPDAGKINGPTLFSLARDYGYTTAMVVGKPKFDHLVVAGSVDNYIYAGFLDTQVLNQALGVIEAGLPDILFVHLPDVDSAGHASGWMSANQLLTISQTDAIVGQLVATLAVRDYLDTTLLIVTSDHGGVGTAHGGDSPEEVRVPWLAVGPGVPAGVTLTDPIMMFDNAATVLQALNIPIPPQWDGRPVQAIFNR
jgi:predicted AlkP superfamily pyrophosphatase or phosphodiesterase